VRVCVVRVFETKRMGITDRPVCEGKEWGMKVVVVGAGESKSRLLRKMSEDAGLSGLVLVWCGLYVRCVH